MFSRGLGVVRIAIALGAIVLLSGQTPAPPPHTDHSGSVRQLLAKFDRDAVAGNLENMMTLFADDVVLFGSGQPPIVGKPAVNSFWTSFLNQFNLRQGVHQIVEITDFNRTVVVRGRALATWDPKAGGAPMVTDNWYLHVFKRQPDGSYRLWRGAFGANATAAATPK